MKSMDRMTEIATGWSDFERHIKDKSLIYVDKTEYVYRMVRKRWGFYLISRPRGFGKSLMCSTLDALFSGKRELFKDFYIGKTSYDFKSYPVIRFDFSKTGTESYEDFLNGIRLQFHANALRNNVTIQDSYPSAMLDELLSLLSEAVVIIDEFDSATINAVSNGKIELAEKIRSNLNSFYKVMKSLSGRIRFLFITGCTKFTGLSIFSAVNNITDISMKAEYASAFGYTEDELVDNFSRHIDDKVRASSGEYGSREELLSAIRRHYSGYRFSDRSDVRVYNPVSIESYFSDSGTAFSDYWMQAGGENALAVTLAEHNDLLMIVEEKPVLSVMDLISFDILMLSFPMWRRRDALSLLYHAGYLTISDADEYDFCVDFPNMEVRRAFLSLLVDRYGSFGRAPSTIAGEAMSAARKGDVDTLISVLNEYYWSFYSTEMKQLKELGIQVIFKVLFAMAGSVDMVKSGLGKLDAMLLTDSHDYIIGFKANGESPDNALSQIAERHYAWILEREKKPLHLIRVDFRSDRQLIASYMHQVYGSDTVEHKTLEI